VQRKDTGSHTAKLLGPIAGLSLIVVGVIGALLMWSAGEVDRISRERDKSILSVVVSQSMDRVAHAQESSTVWDDAVRQLRARPVDQDWIDINLGIWFESYAGHDEVYILGARCT
jgi:sensor domain CHASE-containing protein